MVVYFSGTGNSRYAAELIAGHTGDSVINSRDFIKNGIAAELISDRPWVFVAPVYAWRLPRVFESFISSGHFDGDRRAYFVLTCGSDIGAAWDHTDALCRKMGFEHMGTAPAIMPENYIAMFSAPSAEESARIMDAVRPELLALAKKIAASEMLPRPKSGFLGRFKSGAVNAGFYKFYISDKKFVSGDKCIACGKCAEVCPLGNIEIAEGKPKWKGNCTHCMACICCCPTEAVEYGRNTVGKRRYWCKD